MTRRRDTEALRDALVGDLRPVGRPWQPGRWWLAWLGVAGGVCAAAIAGHGRPDLGAQSRDGFFVLEVGACAALALRLARASLDAAVPDRRNPDVEWAGPALGLAAVLGLALLHPADRALFAVAGERWTCVLLSVAVAVLPAAFLMAGARRGAPLAPRGPAMLAGAAAGVLAYGVMRLACPAEEGLHLLVWHALPVTAAVTAAALAGTRWLAGWERGDPGR